MTILKLKRLIGINELAPIHGIKFFPWAFTYFDPNKLHINSELISNFKPAIAVLNSGWIIDGRILITDDGDVLQEGFNWDTFVFNLFRKQNEKLKVCPDPKNLSVVGFKDDKGKCDINREIDNNEVIDTIFISGFDNLSHYMMEIAPKSLLFSKILEKNPNIKTVTTSNLVPKKWIDYSIKTAESISKQDFGLTVKQFNPDKAIRFKNIIAITSTTYRGSDKEIKMSVQEARAFSQQMRKNAFTSSNNGSYILYLSRKHASHRKTVNQDNLIKIVKKVFPKFRFVLEDQIHKLSMEDQAKLIRNASLIIEEGGGSTGFTTNLIGEDAPYVCISTTQRKNHASKVYLSSLGKYAAWILGEPVGKLTESLVIDNDIQVDESEFYDLMIRLLLFLEKKITIKMVEGGDRLIKTR